MGRRDSGFKSRHGGPCPPDHRTVGRNGPVLQQTAALMWAKAMICWSDGLSDRKMTFLRFEIIADLGIEAKETFILRHMNQVQ